MATLNEICTDLQNIIRGGALVTDDEPISKRQIAFWVKNTRATLLKQQVDKGQEISDNITQIIFVPIEQVDTSLISSRPKDCYIARTTTQIPVPLVSQAGELILSISAPGYNTIPYTKLPNSAIVYSDYNPYGCSIPKASLDAGYIIIKDLPFTEYIMIAGVFEDPEQAGEFTDPTTNKPCWTWDTEYPINRNMIEIMKSMITDVDLKLIMRMPSDDNNNSAFDLKMPVQK